MTEHHHDLMTQAKENGKKTDRITRRPPGLYRRGHTWWTKVYINGQPVRESTGCRKWEDAKRVLDQRRGRVATGEPMLPRMDRIVYDEAAADLRQHYLAHGTRNLKEYEYRVAHLTRVFRGRRLATIDQVAVDAYIAVRQAEGVVGSTIRRELGTLTKLLRLACKNKKLGRVPMFDKPKEGDPRAGFFELEQYAAVRRQLPADLQLAVAIGYAFGWRMQSEILMLERRQLDLEAGTLRLDPGTTKNGEGRVVYLTPELTRLCAEQLERIRTVERKTGRIIPYLFPYLSGPKRLGQRRRDFRKAWATACEEAAVPGHYRHDLRRSAVRNMERAGVSRSVAMKITGHRTENVYRRYAIVSDADLREAAAKLAAMGTMTGTRTTVTVDRRPQIRDTPGTGG